MINDPIWNQPIRALSDRLERQIFEIPLLAVCQTRNILTLVKVPHRHCFWIGFDSTISQSGPRIFFGSCTHLHLEIKPVIDSIRNGTF
jgi:hypothetical protein